MSASRPTDRIPGLDGLRAIAVLGVFAFHAGIPGAQLGWAGVELFYVLSGFLITGILLDTRDRPGYFFRFYARRALRILPPYYLVVVLSAIIAVAVGASSSLKLLPYYAFYLQNYHPQLTTGFAVGIPLLSHTWTLAIEEQFYWLWPLAIVFARGRVLLTLLVAAIASGPLSRLALLLASGNAYASVVTLPAQIDLLSAGALVAVAMRSGLSAAAVSRAGTVAFATGTLALAGLVAPIGLGPFATTTEWAASPAHVLVFTAMAIGFAGLVAVTVSRPGLLARALSVRPLSHLGRISYGLYVYGPLGLFAASAVFDAMHAVTDRQSPSLPVHALGFAVTYLIALASWRYIESPILGLKRRFDPAPAELASIGHPRRIPAELADPAR